MKRIRRSLECKKKHRPNKEEKNDGIREKKKVIGIRECNEFKEENMI